MAKARAIAKRRKAVQNIRKITRTMQLIATARFQAAFNRATATRPYTDGITRLVQQLSRAGAEVEHPLLKVNTESKRSAVLVITSNRGLCGGYNSSILRKSVEHMKAEEARGRTVGLHAVGKKGIAYFKFIGREMVWRDTKLTEHLRYPDVEALAATMMDAYERRQFDAVYVVAMKFVSAGSQFPQVTQLLPIEKPEAVTPAGAGAAPGHEVPVQYEFSPPAGQLLAELLPEVVRVRLFQCFNDAIVSEHTARMVAMKAATDAAGDMIRSLTQRFNRARQSQITLELLDIVAGAEALA